MAPFSLLYGLGVQFRNFLYNNEILKSIEFDVPVIGVGNLSTGGTGKTPHTEFLIQFLKDYIQIATISRGYRRKTKGFSLVHPNHAAEQVGDEPLLFKRKYPDVLVAVSEDRIFAVPHLIKAQPHTKAILLDDAYQHRSIDAGMNILLTTYQKPFFEDHLLPSGRLREWRAGYQRADKIIVTKCPPDITEADRQKWIEKLQPLPHQKVYFTYYKYYNPYYSFNPAYTFKLSEKIDVLLVCGIAHPEPLVKYLEERVGSVHTLEFADHHNFTKEDISKIKKAYDFIKSDNKVIITTEKDAMRLDSHRKFFIEEKLPLYSLPIQVKFLFEEQYIFEEEIIQYLMDFKS